MLLPAIGERTVSAAEIEAAGGLSSADLAAIMEAFGLPGLDPTQPAFTPEEAQVHIELAELREIWPVQLGVQLARVYGQQLNRVAQAEVQLFRSYVEPRISSEADDRLAGLRAVEEALARLLPLADPIMLGVHRRLVEHALKEAAIGRAEAQAGDRGLPGAVEIAVLFCDLKDFSAFAELEGDAAAAEAVAHFAGTTTRERGARCRLTKALGDGYLLVYADPAQAVAVGARIVAAMRCSDGLAVHASVHHGVAIAREGDFYGRTLNLAARLLATAGPDELVATRAVVDATAGAFRWAPAGSRTLRGFRDPIDVFRLTD